MSRIPKTPESRPSLHATALFAWRRELIKIRDEAAKYRQIDFSEGLRLKLESMFGPGHVIEVESAGDPDNQVLGAVIDELSFLAIRQSSGHISVYLLIPCAHCGHQMPSAALSNLSDLGRELVQFGMKGNLGDHQCPAKCSESGETLASSSDPIREGDFAGWDAPMFD